MVDTAEESAAQHVLLQVADAVVRVVRGWRVVHREHHAGNNLNEEDRQRRTSQRVRPREVARHLAVEQLLLEGANVNALVEPAKDWVHGSGLDARGNAQPVFLVLHEDGAVTDLHLELVKRTGRGSVEHRAGLDVESSAVTGTEEVVSLLV